GFPGDKLFVSQKVLPNMDVAITGTPGTGKTTLCAELASFGHAILSVAELALELDCGIAMGDEMEVDVSSLAAKMHGYTAGMGELVFIDGHLSHHLPVDFIIVLRARPSIVRQRLLERNYPSQKVQENVEAELVGVCLSEAVDTGLIVAEVDATSMSVDALVKEVLALVEKVKGGEGLGPYMPGNVDWLSDDACMEDMG
ncbi:MAG: AAA family ATPase, partial [Candidatus Thermoplasmatota archaeon]|nr:AAA family ATPase [Candidatus Thermoplasmatota archaeon]